MSTIMKPTKLLSILAAIVLGFVVSTYISERAFVTFEIEDYQKDISIASRLLKSYADNCNKVSLDNFLPYVEHATTAYERKVAAADGFPFFISEQFVKGHQESVYKYKDEVEQFRLFDGNCDEV